MKAKFTHYNAHLELKWKSDFQKEVILENFTDRNWEPAEEDEGKPGLRKDDWNIYWGSVGNIRKIFNPKLGFRLSDEQ